MLPRKIVQYVQSMDNVEHYDKYHDYEKYTCEIVENDPKTKKADAGKYPGTVYNKIRNKNRIQIRNNKETNTTAEVKQKQIINKITVKRGKRKANDIGVSTYL